MPARPLTRLLEGMRQQQDPALFKRPADELQTQRQAAIGKPAGHGNGAQPEQIRRDGVAQAQQVQRGKRFAIYL